jgi:hypothetical protein
MLAHHVVEQSALQGPHNFDPHVYMLCLHAGTVTLACFCWHVAMHQAPGFIVVAAAAMAEPVMYQEVDHAVLACQDVLVFAANYKQCHWQFVPWLVHLQYQGLDHPTRVSVSA